MGQKQQLKAEGWRQAELRLAVFIIRGPVGYHSVWRHKAELALHQFCCQITLPVEIKRKFSAKSLLGKFLEK